MSAPVTPPSASVFPSGDADLAVWAVQFAAAWVPATFGVTDPSEATLDALSAAFAADLAARIAVPTPASVVFKNNSRANLVLQIRSAARIANAAFRSGTVSSTSLTALGLRVPDLIPTTIFPPTDAPLVAVDSVSPGVGRLRLTQIVGGVPVNTRGFPYGAANAVVERRIVGGEWMLDQVARRINIFVDLSGFPIGTIVQYRVAYANPRGQRGPFSPAVSVVSL